MEGIEQTGRSCVRTDMSIDVKQWCPETEHILEEHHVTKQEDSVLIAKLVKLSKHLERQLMSLGHERLKCANCGAERTDTDRLTGKFACGSFTCPLCGHNSIWKRITRFSCK